MTSLDSLRLVSCNCRGWNSDQHAVCDLLQSCDVCMIQEHWLLHEQLSLLNINNDFLSSGVSYNEYLTVLGELEGFRHTSDHILIAGDFNVDFGRASITLQHLCTFMTELNLVSGDLPFHSSIGFTYMRDDGSASSWPDHFICDTSLAPDLSLFRRVDFGSNLSDHSALACSLQVDLSVHPPPLLLLSPQKPVLPGMLQILTSLGPTVI